MKRTTKKTILIVDDEPTISQVCNKVLSSNGYRVDIATNPKIAREILDIKEYDLCLLDIRTPAMNGIELFRWLSQKHPRQANRIIFTSGYYYDQTADNNQLRFKGQVLPKPFTNTELREAVGKFFEETTGKPDKREKTEFANRKSAGQNGTARRGCIHPSRTADPATL